MQNIHITQKSSNKKTGPMPVTTSARQTCPDTCSLKKNGCYADSGPLALHWDKVSAGGRGVSFGDFVDIVAGFAPGTIWRHNQAGDLKPANPGHIDGPALGALVSANKKARARGFTYTHYSPDTGKNAELIRAANAGGFTINLSGESLEHADWLAGLKIGPVVTITPEGLPKKFKTPGGRDVVQCPATYKDGVSCFTCGLCQLQRDTIVGFPVHGTSKKKAHKVFMLRSETP